MGTEEPVKGRARLSISDELIRLAGVKVEKPKAGALVWGTAEVQELFDLFASFLMLPESYTILGVFFEVAMYCWVLVVESEHIPLPQSTATMLPELVCAYERTADGKVRLSDCQLWR